MSSFDPLHPPTANPPGSEGTTQFGMLKVFSIVKNGAYLNSEPFSKEPVFSDLKLWQQDFIDVTIGIKKMHFIKVASIFLANHLDIIHKG